MNLLEKVLTYLRKKCEQVYLDLEKEYPFDTLVKYISDDPSKENLHLNE